MTIAESGVSGLELRKRKEDLRILLGKGEYIANITLPNTASLVFLRSPYAHAKILSIDVSEAKRVKGVIDVITGDEIKRTTKQMIPPEFVPRLWLLNPSVKFNIPKYHILATDKVRYAGEPVAAVIAENPYIASDAVQLISVDYEPLPPVIDAEKALDKNAPRVYEDLDDNIEYYEKAKFGDTDKAFNDADFVFTEKFYSHRTGAAAMENRGCLAQFDPYRGLTAWVTTQRPFQWRDAFASILNFPHHKIRVIAPNDIGGSFGTKAAIFSEELVVAYASMKTGRPVKWLETRYENLTTTSQAREEIHNMSIAFKKDGVILGLRDDIIANVGAGMGGVYLGMLMTWLGAYLINNAYMIPNIEFEIKCVLTNKGPLQPSRAFGTIPPRFALERLIDIAAREMGIDRAEIRVKNMVKNFPYTSPTGVYYDGGDYIGAFRKCLDILNYEQLKKEKEEARKKGRYIGVGIVPAIEIGGLGSGLQVLLESIPTYGVALVRVDWEGGVTVFVPDVSFGTGHETILSQLVAGELGISPDKVSVVRGDTLLCPYGQGWYAQPARNASAVVLAAKKIKEKAAKLASHILKIDAPPEDFVFAGEEVTYAKDPSKRMSFRELAAKAILDPGALPPGMEPGLEAVAYHELKVPTLFSIDVHGVVVEVDPLTCNYKILRYVIVDDSGKPINSTILRGQIQGGITLGMSNATLEEFIYDESGNLLTGNLSEYRLLPITETVKIEIYEHHTPTPHTVTGGKGKGEGLPMGVPAAIANALEDALQPFGVKITELPLKPEKIWRQLGQKQGKTG